MTDLDRLLHDLPISPAPIDELIATGHARRRRRRGLTVIAVVTGVLVVGGIAIGSHPVGDDDRAIQPAGPTAPSTDVITHDDEPAFSDASAGLEPSGRPVWDADSRTLRYLSSYSYDGCGANASSSWDNGALVIELTPDPGRPGFGCTAIGTNVVTVVHGLQEQPRSVVVIDHGIRQVWPAIA